MTERQPEAVRLLPKRPSRPSHGSLNLFERRFTLGAMLTTSMVVPHRGHDTVGSRRLVLAVSDTIRPCVRADYLASLLEERATRSFVRQKTKG